MPPAKKAAAGRTATTTTTRQKKATVIDLDALMDLDLVNEEDVVTKRVKMFGEEFTIYVDVNSFLLTGALAEDQDALIEMFKSLMPEEDYRRFTRAMGKQRGMDGANMARVFAKLLEVAADRPTG